MHSIDTDSAGVAFKNEIPWTNDFKLNFKSNGNRSINYIPYYL